MGITLNQITNVVPIFYFYIKLHLRESKLS